MSSSKRIPMKTQQRPPTAQKRSRADQKEQVQEAGGVQAAELSQELEFARMKEELAREKAKNAQLAAETAKATKTKAAAPRTKTKAIEIDTIEKMNKAHRRGPQFIASVYGEIQDQLAKTRERIANPDKFWKKLNPPPHIGQQDATEALPLLEGLFDSTLTFIDPVRDPETGSIDKARTIAKATEEFARLVEDIEKSDTLLDQYAMGKLEYLRRQDDRARKAAKKAERDAEAAQNAEESGAEGDEEEVVQKPKKKRAAPAKKKKTGTKMTVTKKKGPGRPRKAPLAAPTADEEEDAPSSEENKDSEPMDVDDAEAEGAAEAMDLDEHVDNSDLPTVSSADTTPKKAASTKTPAKPAKRPLEAHAGVHVPPRSKPRFHA